MDTKDTLSEHHDKDRKTIEDLYSTHSYHIILLKQYVILIMRTLLYPIIMV